MGKYELFPCMAERVGSVGVDDQPGRDTVEDRAKGKGSLHPDAGIECFERGIDLNAQASNCSDVLLRADWGISG